MGTVEQIKNGFSGAIEINLIATPRFILRELTESDATETYSAWLDEKSTTKFIKGSQSDHSVAHLREYIRERSGRKGVIFLGIFTRDHMEHIGNIKYEPVNIAQKYAVMGILIGVPSWRGKGVAHEVIEHTTSWLYLKLGIIEFILGVDSANGAAIRAYEKAGFKVQETDKISVDRLSAISMVLNVGTNSNYQNEVFSESSKEVDG